MANGNHESNLPLSICRQTDRPPRVCVKIGVQWQLGKGAGHCRIQVFGQGVQRGQIGNRCDDLVRKQSHKSGHDSRKLRIAIRKVGRTIEIVEKKSGRTGIPRIRQHVRIAARKASVLKRLDGQNTLRQAPIRHACRTFGGHLPQGFQNALGGSVQEEIR